MDAVCSDRRSCSKQYGNRTIESVIILYHFHLHTLFAFRTIKHTYLNNRKNKRVDEVIYILRTKVAKDIAESMNMQA